MTFARGVMGVELEVIGEMRGGGLDDKIKGETDFVEMSARSVTPLVYDYHKGDRQRLWLWLCCLYYPTEVHIGCGLTVRVCCTYLRFPSGKSGSP